MFPSEGYFYLKCQKNGLVVSVNNEEKVQLQKNNRVFFLKRIQVLIKPNKKKIGRY